jgi:type II secretory ATPase GspE/PulE/Tfp pilus assembly ATPase PilB-like protein
MKTSQAMHSTENVKTLLSGIRNDILGSYEADMATIYLVDSAKREIFSWAVLPGDRIKEIRIPISNRSIAGYVAHNKKVINIQDVYDRRELIRLDPALTFDSSWDKKSGIRTRQVLATPILWEKFLFGVIQLLNKRNGHGFTVDDQKYLFDLAVALGKAFHNLQKTTVGDHSKYELLVSKRVISRQDLANAEAIAQRQERDVYAVLLKDYGVSREELGAALSQFYGIPFEDLTVATYNSMDLLEGKNLNYFRRAHCVPLYRKDGKIILAIDDPDDQIKIQEIKQVLRTDDIEYRIALKEDIEAFIDSLGPGVKPQINKADEKSFNDIIEEMRGQETPGGFLTEEKEGDDTDDRATVMLVRKIIEDAHRQNASDIHIEPYGFKQDAQVRYRIDGRCAKVLTIPKNHIRAVVSRLKILAKLDIAERRQPQDGKIRFQASEGRNIEIRVSTIPTVDGNEDIVLRLLANNEPLPLNKIMPQHIYKPFTQLIRKPYGLVLVVGPTGSGKTTTLHSALSIINTPERKIWTAEDPVEITQFRLRQVQINPKIGLTFAAAMRAFLRADPDVIMVGEMRDQETVKIAIEASLTGHLVFSTLHTNSAPETITRLIDMGMDPFNFADALLGVVSQRLVRTLCDKCKKAYHPPTLAYDHLKKLYGPSFDQEVNTPYTEDLQFYQAVGCELCNNTGYKGRMGLFELLVNSRSIKKSIIERAGVAKIRKLAIREGMTTLMKEGIHGIFMGHTDPKQVIPVCSSHV